MKTWILTAQKAEARIYEHAGAGKELVQLETIAHEDGRLKDGAINADRAGRSFDSHGSRGHATETQESPSERVASNFARSLAAKLDTERQRGSFHQLIIVAEPHMLGLIRKSLNSATAALMGGSVAKEFHQKDGAHLEKALSKLIRIQH